MKNKTLFLSSCISAVVAVVGLFVPVSSPAGTIVVDVGATASGIDDGPQDGVYDSFVNPGPEMSVDNNGFTSIRGAFEFPLAAIPHNATIAAAQLLLWVDPVDGTRQIQLHGYAGDGVVTLTDFSRDGFIAGASLDSSISMLTFDVTDFLKGLLANGDSFAGFNLREDPPNIPNFLVMFFPMFALVQSRLSVDFTSATAPESLGGWVAIISLLGILVAQRLDLRQTFRRHFGPYD